MGYITTGEVHWKGTKAEKAVATKLNKLNNQSLEYKRIIQFMRLSKKGVDIKKFYLEPVGGTHNVVDIKDKINNFNISLKSRKKNASGTFDLVNASSILGNKCLNQKIKNHIQHMHEYKSIIRNQGQINCNLVDSNKVRKEIKNQLITFTKYIDKTFLKKILYIASTHYKNIDSTIINHYDTQADNVKIENLIFLHPNWIQKEISIIDLNQKIYIGKQSCRLKYTDGNNSHFRIRATYNNGIGALIGCNRSAKQNKNSHIAVKIQIDNVNQLIEKYQMV